MTKSDHSNNLKKKSLTAVLWSGADIFARQGLQFIVSIILARLLSPEEFGTVALLYLFTGLAAVFVDSGFSAALVQRQDLTHKDESSVFWLNMLIGALMSLTLWSIAPWIAGFYQVPELVPLTGVLAVTIFINSMGGVHHTLLSKKLDFKPIMRIGVASTLVSGAVAIALAANGYGIWSLALQAVAGSVTTTTLLWLFSAWRPRWTFSFDSVRKLFRFGGYLMLSSLLDVAYNRIYTLLIGKIYSVRELGFYSRADNTKQIPVEMLSGVLARVAFPIFSSAAHDKEKLRRGTQHALRGMMLINVPMMFGLMATAENVVQVLYGDKWLPAVPMLKILCLAGVFWPLHVINLNVLKAQGHSNLFFRLEIIKKVIGTLLLVLGVSYGVMGIAWSQVAYAVFAFLINAYYTKHFLNYGSMQQALDIFPILLLSGLMSYCVNELGLHIDQPPLLLLMTEVIFGASMFIICCWLFRLQAFKSSISLISWRN